MKIFKSLLRAIITMRMEYIVMLTAISNKKLTKLVATRPSQEDFPHFPITLSPFPSVPPEKVFYYYP